MKISIIASILFVSISIFAVNTPIIPDLGLRFGYYGLSNQVKERIGSISNVESVYKSHGANSFFKTGIYSLLIKLKDTDYEGLLFFNKFVNEKKLLTNPKGVVIDQKVIHFDNGQYANLEGVITNIEDIITKYETLEDILTSDFDESYKTNYSDYWLISHIIKDGSYIQLGE